MKKFHTYSLLLITYSFLCAALTANATTAIDWVGGGADNLTTTLANWSIGGETPAELPDLTGGTLDVTIKGGTGMTYRDGDKFNKIVNAFPVTNGIENVTSPFYIEPASDGAKLELVKGLTSQYKRQLVLKGHIGYPEGGSRPQLRHDEWACKKSEAPSGLIYDANYYDTWGGSAPLVLAGVTLDMDIYRSANASKEIILIAENTTNYINGTVTAAAYQCGIGARTGAYVKFLGNYGNSNWHHFFGPGTFEFAKSMSNVTGGISAEYGATMVFSTPADSVDAKGNASREGMLQTYGNFEFISNNCFTTSTQYQFYNADNVNTIDFHSTTQRFGRAKFTGNNAESYLTGEDGSMVELTFATRSGATLVVEPSVNVQVKGGLGFHMMGAASNVFVLAGQDFASSGDLIVSSGTNRLAATATWLNGINFVMKGDGVMEFAKAGQVNAGAAEFHFSDNGKVYIPQGVTQEVRIVVIDGATETILPAGDYTAESTGTMANRVAGKGVLRALYDFRARTFIRQDMTAAGDWEVTVDEGCTNIVVVPQTGTGKITKLGRGVLVMRATSSFTGGIDLKEGFVYVEADDALGFGEVKIFGSKDRDDAYEGPCELRFTKSGVTCGSESSNGMPAIHVVGQNTAKYPAIGIHSATNEFYGNITADYDLYVMEDSYWLKLWYDEALKPAKAYWSTHVSANDIMHYYGAITVAGKLHLVPDARHYFHGPVKAQAFETIVTTDGDYRSRGNTDDAVSYGEIHFFSENEFGRIVYGYRDLKFRASGAMGGAQVTNNSTYIGNGDLTVWSGTLQKVASLYNRKPTNVASGNRVYGGTDSMLVVTGMAANVELATYTTFAGLLSLVLDAPDNPGYTMTLLGRTSNTAGKLVVSNGVFKLQGDANFSSLASIEVEENGKLIVESSTDAFAVAPKLVVNGELTADTGVRVFKSGITISDFYLSSNAKLKLNGESLKVTRMYVDGVQVKADTYSSEGIPGVLEGVTITVTSGDYPAATTTAEWIGGDDLLTTTMANWNDSPASLPLTDGSMQATLKSGAGMKVAASTWLNTIVNETDQVTDGKINTFMIEPEQEGGKIVLSRGLTSLGYFRTSTSATHAQLFLKGRFGLPYGAKNCGAATMENAFAIKYITQLRTKDVPGYYEPVPYSTSQLGLPLTLSGATLDVPLYIYGESSLTMLNATNDSYNVLNAPVSFSGYQSSTYYADGSLTVFRGGLDTANCHHFYGAGTIRFDTKPITVSNGGFLRGSVVAVFNTVNNNVTGNASREGLGIQCGTIECITNDCFTHTLQIYSSGNSAQIMKLHQTTQQVGNVSLTSTDSKSYLHGDYPAMLEITGQLRKGETDAMIYAPRCTMPVKGGLGFHYAGTNKLYNTFTLSGRAFESCGDLVVSEGTLELASGASWLNGTNFVAQGTGTLKFAAASQINSDIAALHLSGSGKVEIPSGVTLKVASAETNGVALAIGSYSAAQLGSLISGGGTLKVGKKGTTIMLW